MQHRCRGYRIIRFKTPPYYYHHAPTLQNRTNKKKKSQVRYKTALSPLNLLLYTVQSKKKLPHTVWRECSLTAVEWQMLYKGMSIVLRCNFNTRSRLGWRTKLLWRTRSSNVFDLFCKQHEDDGFFCFGVGDERWRCKGVEI